MIEPLRRSSALLFLWLGLVWVTFELFLVLDWGHGQARVILLAVLATLLWVCRRWAPWFRSLRTPSRATSHAAVVLVVIGALANLGPWLYFVQQSLATHTVQSDQAETVMSALDVLEQGANPYGSDTVTDSVAYDLATEALAAEPTCRGPGGAVKFRVGRADDSTVPHIVRTAGCEDVQRMFSSLGFKYGPVMLAFYWPFIALFGTAGFLIAHLVLVIAFSVLLYRTARETTGSTFWASISLLPLLWPTVLAWNVLAKEHLDFLPICLVAVAWLCWSRGLFGAAGAFIGVSLAAKFLPALLFVPLLAKAPRRFWPVPVIVAAALFTPFAAWSWHGFWQNIGYPFTRPPDSTALVFFCTHAERIGVRVLAIAILGGLALRAHLRAWDRRSAVTYLVFAHIAVLASGTALHNNYLVWLLPLVSLYLTEEVGRTDAPVMQ